MKLEEFKEKCLVQKDVVTRKDLIGTSGGHAGTATSYTTQTRYSHWANDLAQLFGGDPVMTTDSHGDWDDEGC